MSKRFIETTMWTQNKWFRKLSPESKLLWMYLISNCDPVGVWEEDVEFASFVIGCQYSIESLNLFEDRLLKFNGKKYWIKDFCTFQYGELKEENTTNKPHQSYISLLKKHSLWIDYTKSLQRPKEKEKDIDTDKAKDKDKMTESHFEKFWQTYPKKEGKKPTRIKFLKLDIELFETIMYALEWQTQSKKWQDGFIPNPETYINQERWNDEKPTAFNSGNGKYKSEPAWMK